MSEGKKEILLGDCLELMKDIPNGSIDAIITDPPYGTTACKWDSVIPFDLMWEQLNRIIKPNGAIVLFGSEPFSSALRMSNINNYKYDWIWDKKIPTGFALVKKQPMRQVENILIFYKKQPTYNRQWIEKDKKHQRKNRGKGLIKDTSKESEVYNNMKLKYSDEFNDTKKNPINVIEFTKTNHKKLHPTQKPIPLMEYLVKTYTNENEVVLDFTAGSGTTAIACLNTKRQFIVMEKEQKYYDIILKRVADFNKNFEPQTLFGNEL